ncbi:hypothetical protein TrVGV298_009807 [Trichoderma virens]|nr:hypothetical protein TrVGV298_009807 [Trichoderma virens]
MLFEQQNPFESSLATFAVPCSASGLAIGRSFGAEWIRNAYHDMATADVQAGTGGIDASIVFEKDRPENPGSAFQETLDFFRPRYTTRSSLSDLFAMAAVFGVGGCSNGDIILPYRAGRVDATGPGPSGVPEPQEDLATHTAKFVKQGFNTIEMIAIVACGHTVGGVHGVDFPEIVPNPQPPPPFGNDNSVFFDTSTSNFDNQVAKEFVANVSQNPLAFGHNNETMRSDFRIFNADGGDMISRMAESQEFFSQTCAALFERMINTVPPNVKLTDALQPLPVKPRKWSIAVNDDKTLRLSLTLRVIDTLKGGSKGQISVSLLSRFGEPLPVATPLIIGNLSTSTCDYPNCGAEFFYYDFNTNIPAEQGISSFTVDIKDGTTEKITTFNNGGAVFPLSDAIQPQMSLCNQTTTTINGVTLQQLGVTARVYNADQFTNISLIVPQPSNFSATISPWIPEVVPMRASSKIAGTNFTLYTGTWIASNEGAPQHPFDVVATGPKRNAYLSRGVTCRLF